MEKKGSNTTIVFFFSSLLELPTLILTTNYISIRDKGHTQQ